MRGWTSVVQRFITMVLRRKPPKLKPRDGVISNKRLLVEDLWVYSRSTFLAFWGKDGTQITA